MIQMKFQVKRGLAFKNGSEHFIRLHNKEVAFDILKS